MSEQLIQSAEKRAFRLNAFFKPYRNFRLELEPQLHQPLGYKPGKNPESSIRVNIFAPLLAEESPSWVESAVLKLSLQFRKIFRVSGCRNNAEQYLRALEHHKQLASLHSLVHEQEQERRQDELVDGVISLEKIWKTIRLHYFPDRADVDDYQVIWSNRDQKHCLASCNMQSKIVRVARALEHPDCQDMLEPLLYHEMCHAIIGERIVNGRRILHGKDFRDLEKQHPRIAELNAWIKAGNWVKAVKRHRKQVS